MFNLALGCLKKKKILNECSTFKNQRLSCKNTDPWPRKKLAHPGPPGAFSVEQDVL